MSIIHFCILMTENNNKAFKNTLNVYYSVYQPCLSLWDAVFENILYVKQLPENTIQYCFILNFIYLKPL